MTREEAIELLKELNPHVPNYDEAIEMAIKALQKQRMPSAERTGKWVNHRNDGGHNIADCSECGNTLQWFDADRNIPKYCCNCGARIEVEQDERI